MHTYIALLRAVNVGGTGKRPMAELKSMCEQAGFGKVRTFIASGNVVFESRQTAKWVAAALASRLATYAGKPIGVLVRTGGEMGRDAGGESICRRAAQSRDGHFSAW